MSGKSTVTKFPGNTKNITSPWEAWNLLILSEIIQSIEKFTNIFIDSKNFFWGGGERERDAKNCKEKICAECPNKNRRN